MARALGGRPIAVSSSPGKVDQLKRLGAESVIDPRADTFQEAMLDATNGVGPQVVLDNVGHPDVFRPCFRSLGHRGRYVFMGQIKRAQINLFPAFVVHKEAVLTGSASTSRPSFAAAMELVRARTVRPIVTAFPLEEAARAHALMDDRQIFGRAVLIP
ncbi:MAG TPA: zinc-binding dehydrogenase [Candidatus Limnocylindria bacterium]